MEDLTRQLALVGLIANFKANTLKGGQQNLTAGVIRSRIDLLERYWNTFQEGHSRLQAVADLQEEDYFQNDVYSSTECQYTNALGHLYDLQGGVTAAANEAPRTNSRDLAPLPRISLPTFSGHLVDWESFRDVFRSLIHLHPNLSNVQKLQYLKEAVQGEAKAALSTLPITDANYTVAWKILVERYDEKCTLVLQHMGRLVHAPAPKGETAAGLRSLLDRVTMAQESLRALDMPVDTWDHWMSFFLIDGLDTETRKDWEKTFGSQKEFPSSTAVSEFITSRIRALRSTSARKLPSSNFRPQEKQVRSFASGTSSGGCPKCQGNHSFHRCPSVESSTPKERRAMAHRCGLCFNCLRPGHMRTQCTLSDRCHQCHGSHHTLLHPTIKRRGSGLTETTPSKKPSTETGRPAVTGSTSTTKRQD